MYKSVDIAKAALQKWSLLSCFCCVSFTYVHIDTNLPSSSVSIYISPPLPKANHKIAPTPHNKFINT